MTKETVNEHSNDLALSARIPPGLVLLIIFGVGTAGIGVGTLAPFGIEKAAVQSCFDQAEAAFDLANTAIGIAESSRENSDLALGVAADHGEELNNTNQRITAAFGAVETLRVDLLERTHSRFTQQDGEKHQRENTRNFDAVRRELDSIERDVNQLQGYHGIRNND